MLPDVKRFKRSHVNQSQVESNQGVAPDGAAGRSISTFSSMMQVRFFLDGVQPNACFHPARGFNCSSERVTEQKHELRNNHQS